MTSRSPPLYSSFYFAANPLKGRGTSRRLFNGIKQRMAAQYQLVVAASLLDILQHDLKSGNRPPTVPISQM